MVIECLETVYLPSYIDYLFIRDFSWIAKSASGPGLWPETLHPYHYAV